MRGTPLHRDDSARLFMGTRENPMVVTAVLRLRGTLAPDVLGGLVESRALGLPRMRARIVVPWLGAPYWREPKNLCGADFVTPYGRAEDDRALAARVAEITEQELDPAYPRWHLWTIVEPAGTTVVARIHHAIADGTALLGVLFALSDEGAGTTPASNAPRPRATFGLGRTPRTERPDVLARPLGGHKRFAWSLPLPLSRLREHAHSASAHVNDVLLAAVAGTLRAFLVRRSAAPHAPLLALVPIALPRADAAGNHFVSAFVPVPVHLDHPVARLIAARDAMRVARTQTGAGRLLVAGTAVTSAIGGRIGGLIERTGVSIAARRVSLVASDLAGPPMALHLGGLAIDSILFASPVPGSVPIAISAFGYAGNIRVTVAVDDAVIHDPWELVTELESELT